MAEKLTQERPENPDFDGDMFERLAKIKLLSISIPIGEIIRCTKLFRNLPLKIWGCVFLSNLIEFNFGDLDVILGMNWLSLYKANIDCEI